MDLRRQTCVSYRQAAVVGFGLSQYQCKVSSVTNLAHVLSFNFVLLKIFSRKLHYSSETYGRSQTTKRGWLK